MNKNPYEILGLNINSSHEDIKKAYKKLALLHHPDRGGNDEKFKIIQNAYEQIINGNKKCKNIIRKTTKAIVINLPITLEEIYLGTNIIKHINVTKFCYKCMGEGGEESFICNYCDGSGIQILTKRFGFNMLQKMQIICTKCQGKGKCVKISCSHCQGIGLIEEEEQIDIVIKPGIQNNEQIVYPQYGNERHGMDRGAVIFIITEIIHPIFTRDGNKLKIKDNISLVDALTGFTKQIRHLDGEIVEIKSNKVINPGSKTIIIGKGIPKNQGELVIEYNIKFPSELIERDLISNII